MWPFKPGLPAIWQAGLGQGLRPSEIGKSISRGKDFGLKNKAISKR